MKYKICFILKAYFPTVSPSGLVIKKLAEELSKDHEIHIISRDLENDTLSNSEPINNIILHRYKCDINNHLFICKLKRTISKQFYDDSIVNTIEYNVRKILDIYDFDYIIPVTYEEIIACSRLLTKYTNIYPFLLEKFFNKSYFGKLDLFYNFREKNNILILKKYMNSSCLIFCLPIVKKYIVDSIGDYCNICILEHPTVSFIKKNEDYFHKEFSEIINITYIGALDKKIRNPRNFLKYLLPLFPKYFNIMFYGYGNCDDILHRYSKRYINFKYYGPIDSEKASLILKSSDIIIIFGNSTPSVVSSKLFEYISTQNPIIHFYQYETDPYIQYLKDYPLSLCVPLNDLNNETIQNKILKFIFEHNGETVSEDIIVNKYYDYTPISVAKCFIKYIEKSIWMKGNDNAKKYK